MTGPAIDARSGTAHELPEDRDDGPVSAANAVEVIVEGIRALGPDRSLADVGHLIATSAATSLPGATDAALTTRVRDRFRTVAQTSDLPLIVNALQYEHGGPSREAMLTSGAVVHIDDLRTETRWPALARAAVDQTPVLGVLSYRLAVGDHDDALGSLTVYATKPHAFDTDTIAAGQRLAAHAALALAWVTERDRAIHLEQALRSSRDIGAAIGILMTRHLLTREQALELLTTTSQNTNRKLRDLAETVIHTGDITIGGDAPATQRLRGQDLATTRVNAQ